jgi:hypothetical protein
LHFSAGTVLATIYTKFALFKCKQDANLMHICVEDTGIGTVYLLNVPFGINLVSNISTKKKSFEQEQRICLLYKFFTIYRVSQKKVPLRIFRKDLVIFSEKKFNYKIQPISTSI